MSIIKRILVGVGIVLVISFLKNNGVLALENQTYQFTFNNSNPIVWKENVPSGGNYNVTIRPVVAFSYDILSNYNYLNVLYTTDYMNGSAHVNGFDGVFSSGDFTPVCLISQNDVKSTCILQIPILHGGGSLDCGVSGGQCVTDNPTITFYNWGPSLSSLNIYGAYFSNYFYDDVSTELANFKIEVINILEEIKNNSSNSNVVGKLQEQIVTQQGTNQRLDSIDNTLNNDSIDSSNTTGTLENLSDDLPTNSVISDLLLLPVRLFQNILNSINGSCSSFSLGSLFNTNINLPCINLQNILGSSLYSVIDILISGIFVLSIRKKFVNIFENLSSLKNGGNELE